MPDDEPPAKPIAVEVDDSPEKTIVVEVVPPAPPETSEDNPAPPPAPPPEPPPPTGTPLGEIPAISCSLEKSAGRAKRTGHVYLIITFVIGFSVLFLFIFSEQFASLAIKEESAVRAQIEGIRHPYINDLKDIIVQINAVAGSDAATKKDLLSLLSSRLAPREQSQFANVVATLSDSLLRIGGVLVGIFLIQIMVGFARYYYRLAEHLRICSLSIRLSQGRVADFEAIIPLMMPSSIDFGKVPHPPIEKLAESALKTVGEVSKKIPSR